ncbi:MAG: hypothetical protein ACK4WH_13345 [Phycisphaerales bacterium]
MTSKSFLAALVGAVVLVGVADAQPLQQMINTDFETVSPADSTLPLGWDRFNGARRRTVGDGLTPALASAHSGVAAVELTPQEFGPSDFIGVTSNALLDPNDILSGRNNSGYLFGPPEGEKLRLSGWFLIPADAPVVNQIGGLKLEFRRTVNDSVYEGFDFLLIDPNNPQNIPGLVQVSTPEGLGVHTDGQWVNLTATFYQQRFRIPLWPLPPENPEAKVTMLAIRFGQPYINGGRGTIFFDDLTLTRVPVCAADFNDSGSVTVQDIFDFLNAYFNGCP